MGTVTIRNLDDEVIERAKQRAKSHHRSLEAELRTILTRELKPLSAEEFFQLADEIRERTRGRPQVDSGILQREGRDWLDRQGGADRPWHERAVKLVVDASVIIKWFAIEELRPRPVGWGRWSIIWSLRTSC